MQQKRVVVTGLGALTPLGNSIPEFWDNLIGGKSGAAFSRICFFVSAAFTSQIYVKKYTDRYIFNYFLTPITIADEYSRSCAIQTVAAPCSTCRAGKFKLCK